jgi:hypothetical protein
LLSCSVWGFWAFVSSSSSQSIACMQREALGHRYVLG